MSDNELIDLYEFEIADIVPAAREELIAELKRRNIYSEDIKTDFISTATFTPSKDMIELLYNFLESGWSSEQLMDYAIERGLNEEECKVLLVRILSEIDEKIKKTSSSITNGTLICAIGLAVRSLPLNTEKFYSLIFLCYFVICIGIGKAFHSYYMQTRLKKMKEKLTLKADNAGTFSGPSGE